MKDIIITENNKKIYKKIIAIKEGKMVANYKCILIPFLLLGIETFLLSNFLLYKPFLDIYFKIPTILVTPIEMFLFGISFYISVKLNISISKNMSLKYLKKENPDINTRVSVKEVKKKLKEYNKNNIPIYGVKKTNIDKSVDKIINSKEKIEFLEHEKRFLEKYAQELKEDESKQKKLKY